MRSWASCCIALDQPGVSGGAAGSRAMDSGFKAGSTRVRAKLVTESVDTQKSAGGVGDGKESENALVVLSK